MRPLARRLWLYGLGAPAAAAAVAGALWKPPADADTLASGARFQLQMGLLEEASRQAATALEQDPDHLEALLVLGACAELGGDREGARALYERSLPLVADPDLTGEIRVAIALAHLDAARLAEAEATLAEAAPVAPVVRAKVSYARGLLRARRGDRPGAVEALGAALEGADPPLRIGISLALAELGEAGRAAGALEPGILAEDPASLYAAARLKFTAGDSEEGATLLRRAAAGGRAWVRRRMRQDETFWQPYRAGGELPADVTGDTPGRTTEEENASGGRNE